MATYKLNQPNFVICLATEPAKKKTFSINFVTYKQVINLFL